ncbi:hypothetical protein H2200_007725 [Cladophialophora chaetospira]|uniref:Pyruvate decarboxylase n=1 Tax=Cladophialophora chaetospira TaxID=386627 RepID=A0AA39CGR2_9EURO|nr:hypothetical protein H2200_007725 [Cladophialophora chaetospira]
MMEEDTIDLAQYLFTRLQQLGVQTIYGVPSDFNLTVLDYVEPLGLSWAGNANELNAGYAADGYARIKGLSALFTAFGVGELSAANAIGGAYAEYAPVVHVVGTPPRSAQKEQLCIHHSLGDGNFRVFSEIASRLTVAQVNLDDPAHAADRVDHALRQCILHSRPVYIELPTDMVKAQVPRARLDVLINRSPPRADEEVTKRCVERIVKKITTAKQPWIIVDGLTSRYGASAEVNELVRLSGIPTSTTPCGKGIVDETLPNFHGVYAGAIDTESNFAWAAESDLILRIGPLDADSNTFAFTALPDPGKTITFYRDSVEDDTCGDEEIFQGLQLQSLLRALVDHLPKPTMQMHQQASPGKPRGLPNPVEELQKMPLPREHDLIDQASFWPQISKFFRQNDIILTETGTASIGSRHLVLPRGCKLINSTLWLSIGYMLPASAGASAAQRELNIAASNGSDNGNGTGIPPLPKGRTILFEGDGSLQMTVQSISDMIRARLDVIMFVLNNNGYTIERWIHGMNAPYNDIQPWRYLDAPMFFGAQKNQTHDLYPIYTKRASTWGELNDILADPDFSRGKGLAMVEVIMDQHDAPETLKKLAEASSKRNFGG